MVDVITTNRRRRRSADIGGLHLATGNSGQGQGWIGDSGELHTQFAELLGDMYHETVHAVNERGSEFIPTDLSTETRFRLIESLDSWKFEPHKLPEEELLACTLILFEGLYRIEGIEDAVGVSLRQISGFVHHLRRIYRLENSYHNFEHALDVLQASYSYLQSAGMVPPLSILLEPDRKWKLDKMFDSGPLMTTLGLQELFVVYVIAIGHDVGHPGFTNVFMKNAETPLSMVFDGKSALEQMHCQLLLRVMRCHGLEALIDCPDNGHRIRRLLWETVVATDMSVHDQFMEEFRRAIAGEIESLTRRQTIICQTILKCADISNPSRPYVVSQYWASALGQEWNSQAYLEKYFGLPATVQPSDNPLIEAKGQIFFISTYVKPLLDLTIQAVPEMKMFADQCASNLSQWSARCEGLKNATQTDYSSPLPTSPRHPDDFMSAFPLTLPPSHRSSNEDPGLVWPTIPSQSSDSSCASSESNPCSPSDSDSSFLFSSTSDSSNSNPSAPPLSASSSCTNNHVNGPPNGHAAIRAAGKLGIRKQRSMNRNSWSPFSTSSTPRSAAILAPIAVTPCVLGSAKVTTNAILVNKPIKLGTTKLPGL